MRSMPSEMRTLRRQANPSPSWEAAPNARESVGSSTNVTVGAATNSPMRPANKDRPFTTASPDSLPVAFCTGYTIIYQPGAATVRDVSLGTPFPGPGITFTGLAVAYKDGSARFFQAEIDGPDHHSAIDGSTIYHFMSPSFNAGGKTYAQLKP